MVCDNILEYIGHTPMVRLNRMTDPGDAEVLVKYEGLNVGGSIKTRTAFNMIKQAKKDGLIDDDKLQEIQDTIDALEEKLFDTMTEWSE
jgi:cysteine synthase A